MLGLIEENSFLNYRDSVLFSSFGPQFFQPTLPQSRALPPIKITYLKSVGIGP